MIASGDRRAPFLLYGSTLLLTGMLSLDRFVNTPDFLATLPLSAPLVILFFLVLIALFFGFLITPFRYWIFSTIILIPLEFSVSVSQLPRLSAIDYIAAVSAFALIARRPPRSLLVQIRTLIPVPALTGFLLFFLYGSIAARLMQGSIKDILRWGEFLYFFFIGCIAMHDQSGEPTPDQIRNAAANMLAMMGLLVSSVAIAQFALSGGRAIESYSTFGHRNGMAAFLSLCLPACAAMVPTAPAWQTIRKTAAFMVLCAFVISYSRGAWMGLGVGVLIVLWKLRRDSTLGTPDLRNALIIILLLIGPLSSLVIMRYPSRGIFSASQRPRYWKAASTVLEITPFWGLGPGCYQSRIRSYLTPEMQELYDFEVRVKKRVDFWQHLHNLYLQVIVEFGLVGFFFWALGFFSLVRASITSTLRTPSGLKPYFLISIIAFLVHNMVDMMMVSSLDILFAFLLAMTIHPQPGKEPREA